MDKAVLDLRISQKRRDKLYIIAQILELTRDGILKTQIMYRANLSFTQVNEHLNFMLRINLLERFTEDGKEFYRATEKGLIFLQRYREINELLKADDFNDKNDVRVPPPNLLRRT